MFVRRNNPERPTVWILDDEPAIVSALQTRLRIEGFAVDVFFNAEELLAREVAADTCLLLDLRLPMIDGFEVLRQLRQRGCEAPIIIISAYGDASTAVQALKEGAVDYFEKPFDPEQLIRRIRELYKNRTAQGTLTRLANRLSPSEAVSLFREIAPALVLAVFAHLKRAADVQVVARVADHLCREDVQTRIRELEHVREGIIDELASFLSDESLLANRDVLMDALESSSAAYRLLALEACLVHTGAA